MLRLDDAHLAVCIGDVAGKGMPAALLMPSRQAALKTVAHQTGSPNDACTQVRDVMLQSLADGTFVTYFSASSIGPRDVSATATPATTLPCWLSRSITIRPQSVPRVLRPARCDNPTNP